MSRALLLLAAVNGLLAVALGAFGAHGLEGRLSSLADGAQRLEWWKTAAHYHLTHALAIGLCAVITHEAAASLARVSGWSFAAGIVLFSGSLYVMTLSGVRWLGAITPLGGVALLLGWGVLCAAAFRMR